MKSRGADGYLHRHDLLQVREPCEAEWCESGLVLVICNGNQVDA